MHLCTFVTPWQSSWLKTPSWRYRTLRTTGQRSPLHKSPELRSLRTTEVLRSSPNVLTVGIEALAGSSLTGGKTRKPGAAEHHGLLSWAHRNTKQHGKKKKKKEMLKCKMLSRSFILLSLPTGLPLCSFPPTHSSGRHLFIIMTSRKVSASKSPRCHKTRGHKIFSSQC